MPSRRPTLSFAVTQATSLVTPNSSCSARELRSPQQGGANGEGEGGASYFYSNMLFNAQGTKIDPVACTESSSTCSNCLFSGGGLSSDTNVTGCWNPPAGQSGCSVSFSYDGYDYDSQDSQPTCGHQSGFEPFAFDLSAICYFNV